MLWSDHNHERARYLNHGYSTKSTVLMTYCFIFIGLCWRVAFLAWAGRGGRGRLSAVARVCVWRGLAARPRTQPRRQSADRSRSLPCGHATTVSQNKIAVGRYLSLYTKLCTVSNKYLLKIYLVEYTYVSWCIIRNSIFTEPKTMQSKIQLIFTWARTASRKKQITPIDARSSRPPRHAYS